MNNLRKYKGELKNWEWVSPVPVYLLASWLMERCIGWRKEASLDEKHFIARFLFCLSVWRQVTTQHAVLHLLQQDSQMLFAQHHGYRIWKPHPEVSCTTPVWIPPFAAHKVCSKVCPLFHLPVIHWQMKGKGEEAEGRREVVASGVKWTEEKKLPTQKNIHRVSVADKLSLPVSFTSLAVICNSSEAERGLRIISEWHLPSQETPFF